MNEAALVFEGVTRRFRRNVALDGLSLEVAPGTVLGLVGRNGAGKTTSLRIAHGILHPDAGRVRTLGLDPVREPREVHEKVSLLSEESSLYPWMRISEIVDFASRLHPTWDASFAADLTRRLDLDPGARIRTLSRGTQAKVALVLAVACRPRLLLLDDPTAGLDPLVRREVLQGVLEAVPAEGGAVVYASHLIHDVERVADEVAFLDAGRLSLHGSLETLKREVRRARAVFGQAPPEPPRLPGQIDCAIEGRLLSVVARGANGRLEQALRAMGASEVTIEPLTLEEILVACLKRGAGREVDDV